MINNIVNFIYFQPYMFIVPTPTKDEAFIQQD